MQPYIRIQHEDFDQREHYHALAEGDRAGAVVTFVGRVRAFDGAAQESLWLEHYAGMTEKVLARIVEQAQSRWPVHGVRIIHRIGELPPGAQIVFVGVSAGHRHVAFQACEFLMDYLKTQAPFWKREGERWVEAKDSDQAAADAWQEDV